MQLQPDDRYAVLQIGDQLIQVEAELAAYIRTESDARGVSLTDVYYEEMREQELDIQAAQTSLAEVESPTNYSDFRRELGLR
ncbi:MAG: hypothetical protein O3C40_29290 [Planctomycetota bacterium]|nr:hypothetical protein [Planctomycetota bacterium]